MISSTEKLNYYLNKDCLREFYLWWLICNYRSFYLEPCNSAFFPRKVPVLRDYSMKMETMHDLLQCTSNKTNRLHTSTSTTAPEKSIKHPFPNLSEHRKGNLHITNKLKTHSNLVKNLRKPFKLFETLPKPSCNQWKLCQRESWYFKWKQSPPRNNSLQR